MLDNSGAINSFLKDARGITFPEFDPKGPDLDFIIVGSHDYNKTGRALYYEIMDRVVNGATLIILDQADRWAQRMDGIYSHKSIQYIRSFHWGNRGRLFAGKSKYLQGLPHSQSMNWEYQVFYKGDVWGIGMGRRGTEPIVCLAAEHRGEIVNALTRIPFGNGEIFLCTLQILRELASDSPQSSVAKKLFLNRA